MTKQAMTAADCVRFRTPLAALVLAFVREAGGWPPERIGEAFSLAEGVEREPLLSALLASPRARGRLSRFLGEGAEGAAAPWLPVFLAADITTLPMRLLLLPRLALRALALYAGVALCCREAAALVLRRDVLVFREAFGEALHRFAVQRAPFLLRDPAALAQALTGGPLEARDAPPDARALVARVHAVGRAALAAYLSSLPSPLDAVLAAKLPEPRARATPGQSDRADGPAALEERFRNSLDALLHKLLDKEADLYGLPAPAA